jgi:tRNA-2-methylthio-N6-dimethylallyladenosine synthase
VNSYHDGSRDFADLMKSVAAVDRSVRVRFMTSHPQDMSDHLIETIATTENLCNSIHLPVQSASDRVLERMNRSYSIAHYLRQVEKIRRAIPGVSLTTDIISGFPGETLTEHEATVALMKDVRYDGAFTFRYSPRENTKAWEMNDDVPDEEKGRRVTEITEVQRAISLAINERMIGSMVRVLVEAPSKKSVEAYSGRTDTNKTVVFPWNGEHRGEYLDVRIGRVNSATLFGTRVQEGNA